MLVVVALIVVVVVIVAVAVPVVPVVAMVLASLLAFGEIALLLISEGNLNAANIVRVVFALGLFGWILARGIRAVHELRMTTLPVRYPPEPLHHVAPHHSDAPHDDIG